MLFVIDSSDRRRIQECGQELIDLVDDEKLAGIPLIVFANKQDLLQALPANEIAEKLGLRNIRDRTWTIQACSAKTGAGLEEGMEWIVKLLPR